MNSIEATSNIIISMINNHFISSPEDIVTAYKKIHEAVRHPEDN